MINIQQYWGTWLYITLVGLCIGSFLNVVIYRLPIMLKQRWQHECSLLNESTFTHDQDQQEPFNLWVPRSRCPTCKSYIRWYDNIPLLGWLRLRGRCHQCGSKISFRYPLIELATALLSLLTIKLLGFNQAGFFGLFFLWILIALTLIDLDEQLLPDNLTLPLLWLGLLVNLHSMYVTLASAVIGAAAGYLILWSIYWIFKLLTGKEGMGYGDFKLLAALGAWLGWQTLPLIILISALMGAMAGLGYLLIRRKNLEFPFGPYLATAGLVTLLWHNTLMTWYLGHG